MGTLEEGLADREPDDLYGGGFIRSLVAAWDCCATCAGGVLARHDRAIKAKGWDEAIDHVWELSDPISTIEHDEGTPMNTVADMRQAKQENPYRRTTASEVTP